MSAASRRTCQVRVCRPDGRLRDLINVNGLDDAERIRGAFAASGLEVRLRRLRHRTPEGLRPFEEVAA